MALDPKYLPSEWDLLKRDSIGHIHLISKDGFWKLYLQLILTSRSRESHVETFLYKIKISQPYSKFELPGPSVEASSESDAAYQAVERCLSFDPDHRPTATELAVQLERLTAL